MILVGKIKKKRKENKNLIGYEAVLSLCDMVNVVWEIIALMQLFISLVAKKATLCYCRESKVFLLHNW